LQHDLDHARVVAEVFNTLIVPNIDVTSDITGTNFRHQLGPPEEVHEFVAPSSSVQPGDPESAIDDDD